MESPNIFEYATSELSQDAVICYFAEWANPIYKEHLAKGIRLISKYLLTKI